MTTISEKKKYRELKELFEQDFNKQISDADCRKLTIERQFWNKLTDVWAYCFRNFGLCLETAQLQQLLKLLDE